MIYIFEGELQVRIVGQRAETLSLRIVFNMLSGNGD